MMPSQYARRLLVVLWIGSLACGKSGVAPPKGLGGARNGLGGGVGTGGLATGGESGQGGNARGTGGSGSGGALPDGSTGDQPGEGGSVIGTGGSGSGGALPDGGMGGRSGGGGSLGTGGRNGTGGSSGFGGDCHYDCFGSGIECHDGVVTQMVSAPVPCQYWHGACPQQQAGTCQRGCAVEHLDGFTNCPLSVCRENYPKKAGDRCADEVDCHPTATVSVDGGVGRTYLRCDTERGLCVEAEGPVVKDWLGRCDPKITSQLAAGAYGVVSDLSCSGGLCVFENTAAEKGCILQGCTTFCAIDEDCPQGAVCQTAAACPTSGGMRGYCKPGERNLIGVGLSCW
jgi:hypothetical protein